MSQIEDRRRRVFRRALGDVPILYGFTGSVAVAVLLMSGFAWLVA